ncbi:MAG TPA: hypothetical protein VKS21_00340 [Spirochaetota bacterium]|nr:hypothetical protein [Spirochaetota bacterium]
MFYLIIILLQILFSFFLFVFFKKRITKAIAGEKVKDELRNLIIDFNQYAERNLTLLEDRKKQIIDELQAVEKRIARQKEKLFFEQKVNLSETVSPKNKKHNRKKQKPAVGSAGRSGKSRVQKPLSLKNYFNSPNSSDYDKLSLPEKIRYLKKQQKSDKLIAKKLQLSLSEIKMIMKNQSA